MKGILIYLVVVAAVLSSCKKSPAEENEFISLRDKSIPEVKAELRGKWQIHYRYGGFSGGYKVDMPGSYLHLKANDSIDVVLNSWAVNTVAVFSRVTTIFGYDANTIDFTGSPWVIDHKRKDSLVLINNHTEPYSYVMTRVP